MPLVSRILIMATIFASAAVASDIPDAGRLLRESAPPPAMKPQAQPPKIVPLPQPIAAEPSGVKVKVAGFTFIGNTVFTAAELTAILAAYVGKELTLTELNGAAAEITNAYRAKGYFLASALIPPQTIKPDGPVVIEIIEGVLEEIRLETKPAETRTPHSLLKRYISRVPPGIPAEEEVISDMVMRVNELPGISSRLLLEPGTQPGASRAVLEVTEGRPYGFSLDSDNYGSYSTGYYRIGGTLEVYSPLHLGDLFTLRGQSSYSGDTQTVQSGYVLPFSGSGTKVGLNYSFVTYQLGESFKSLNATGTAHDLSLSVTQPLIRGRNVILNFSLGGDGKLLEDKTGSTGTNSRRHLSSWQSELGGIVMDSYLGGGTTSFSIKYTNGFVGIDDETNKATDQTAVTGLHTNGGYNKVAMSLSRNQNIYKTLSLYTAANGQWADKNLDSSEQFSLGGPIAVRAFPVSEASCDEGYTASSELRYLIDRLGVLPGSLQLTAFFDYGHAVLHANPVAPENTRDLSGAGFGVSWFDSSNFSVRTTAAWRTTGTATGKSAMTDPTVYFQAMKQF